MRILFVDLLLKYVNPTRNLLPRLFLEEEVAFFGPGYVSSEVLREGLASFIRLHGPFDVLIATEHIVFSDIATGAAVDRSFLSNYSFYFPPEFIASRSRIMDEIRSLSMLKVAMMLESDYYNFSEDMIRVVDRDFDLIVGWNEQFVCAVSDLNKFSEESFHQPPNDNWRQFVLSNRSKIIPLVHFVSDVEFDYSSLEYRLADFSVPGTPYVARRRALSILKASGCSLSRTRKLPIIRILKRFSLNPPSKDWLISNSRQTFCDEIRHSRISYTCGSRLNYPVRKYFEIPALGAVLVSTRCSGYEDLGFVHGVNAILCEPEELPSIGRTLLSDPEFAQSIADAGRHLISSRHTVVARSRQLLSALRSALQGRWLGGRWCDGNIQELT